MHACVLQPDVCHSSHALLHRDCWVAGQSSVGEQSLEDTIMFRGLSGHLAAGLKSLETQRLCLPNCLLAFTFIVLLQSDFAHFSFFYVCRNKFKACSLSSDLILETEMSGIRERNCFCSLAFSS